MARKSLRGVGADLYSPPTEAHQPTSTPAYQRTTEDATKATFYLSSKTLHDLDRAWMAHRDRDRRVSKSALVEQALREFLAKAVAA